MTVMIYSIRIIGLAAMLATALPVAVKAAIAIPQSREQVQLSFAPVAKKASQAVVNIYTKRRVVDRGMSPFFRDPFFQQFFAERYGMFGMPQERVVSSLGSGVIIDGGGLVVTNFHVIKDADDITAILSDASEYAAKVLLRDEQSDLALLQLQKVESYLPSLDLRDSDTLEVGDLVLAIGNPFGVGQTVTSGIVSAPARSAEGINDFGFFIQTDAAINPGNSGGALIDMQGRLVGVPSAIYTRSGGSNGIGFAIPANMVRTLIAGKQRNGQVVKPWLGAHYQNITRELAESLGLERNLGVLISDVIAGSPAASAGFKAGDVLIAFDGKAVNDRQALRFRTATADVGRMIPAELMRDGKPIKLEVRLEYPPEQPARDARTLTGNHPLSGLHVANLNPALAIELGLDPALRGVVITEDSGQMRAGDRILSINRVAIESTRQLATLLNKPATGWNIAMERGGQPFGIRVMP